LTKFTDSTNTSGKLFGIDPNQKLFCLELLAKAATK
jgi:hypothetical protein